MAQAPTRILLVEDHELVRSGIRALLEKLPDVTVVGEAKNGRQGLELCEQLQPDLVLMDVAMEELNGIEAVRQIVRNQPGIRILMLSMHGDRRYVCEAMTAGASGYVLKGAAFSEVREAIRTVMTGRRYFSGELADLVLDDYVRKSQGAVTNDELEKLSAREREVLQLVAEGRSSAEVAGLLHISIRTVDAHRQNLMDKLKVHSIAGLTKLAIRCGLTQLH